jgi:NADH:ubiquinone oxidoreductase subunit E
MAEDSVFPSKEAEAALNGICERYLADGGNTISLLQDVQEEFGYIPSEAVGWVSDRLEIPESRFFGIATFYAQFYLKPRGENIVTACSGTACHVKGSERMINALRRELNLHGEDDTTEDMNFTLEKVNCVGACSIAPVVIINKKVHGKAASDKIIREIRKLSKTGAQGIEEEAVEGGE